MLEVLNLHVFRGATHVLKDLSLSVGHGEIVALVGANGAGKSTVLQTLSGLLRPRSGAILYQTPGGQVSLESLRSDRIVAMGVVQAPEGRQIFASLSVRENLEIGAFRISDSKTVKRALDQIFQTFPILYERRAQAGGSLSGGEQMMLALARALVAQPRLLLLDEPSLGLAPKITEQIFDMIAGLKAADVTTLLVEQNAAMALEIADRGYVLETGEITHTGTGSDLLQDDIVRQAYLGGVA